HLVGVGRLVLLAIEPDGRSIHGGLTGDDLDQDRRVLWDQVELRDLLAAARDADAFFRQEVARGASVLHVDAEEVDPPAPRGQPERRLLAHHGGGPRAHLAALLAHRVHEILLAAAAQAHAGLAELRDPNAEEARIHGRVVLDLDDQVPARTQD